MELIFGIPSRRRKREEKHAGQAVLVIMPAPTEEGKNYRFELSLTAHKQLKLDTGSVSKRVGIAFKENRLFIANVSGKSVSKSFTYTNNRSFSNKEMHQYITEEMKLDPTKEHVLEITNFQESESANFVVSGEVIDPNAKKSSTEDSSKTEKNKNTEAKKATEEKSEDTQESGTMIDGTEESPSTPVEAESTSDVQPEPLADLEESAS